MIFFDESLNTFEIFSGEHLLALLFFLVLIFLVFLFKKPLKAHPRLDKGLRYGVAIAMVSMEWIFYLWVIIPGAFNLGLLPFGLCSISMYLTAITLLTDNEKIFKIVYPWAVSGALLSLIVADMGFSFPHFRFLHYFGNHGMFLVANIYLAVVKGYRLTYKDLLKSCMILFLIAIVLFFLNGILGTNHMFLHELPAEVAPAYMWMGEPWWLFGYGFSIFLLFHLVSLPLLIHPKKRIAS
jgi:hypothetical integral membrane protein (TIGR02206 family)